MVSQLNHYPKVAGRWLHVGQVAMWTLIKLTMNLNVKQEALSSIYVSVNFKPDHPPPRATPGDSHVPTARGVRFLPNFLCLGGRGFELEKFSTVLKEKCRNFSICFKETGGSLKSRCLCAVSYQFLQKRKSRCPLYLWLHRPFSVISIKFSGHPRVIFANAGSSLKF